VAALLTASCSNIVIVPHHEYEVFNAKPISSRTIEAPKVMFTITDDVVPVCEKLVGKLQVNKKYLGCAHWNKISQDCTVFMPPNFQNVILGHEVRHCFEGSFH